MPRRTAARAASPRVEKMLEIALEMEEPIHDTIHLVRALRMMGDGMGGLVPDEDGQSIVTVARAASDRLEALQEDWNRMLRVARAAGY